MEKDELVVTPKLKGNEEYKVFSIRVKESTISRIDEISARTNRSRNELIGLFLDYAVDRCVIEDET